MLCKYRILGTLAHVSSSVCVNHALFHTPLREYDLIIN